MKSQAPDTKKSAETTGASATPYVDRLIEGAGPESTGIIEDPPEKKGLPRYYELTYHFGHDDAGDGPARLENTVSAIYRFETLTYGTGQVQVEGGNADRITGETQRGYRLAYRHSDLVLSPSFQTDFAAGHIHSRSVSREPFGGRFQLPGSLIEGGRARFSAENTDVDLTFGSVGRLAGTAGRFFEKTEGDIGGVEIDRRHGNAWRFQGRLWYTKEVPGQPDHYTFGGGWSRRPPAGAFHYQFQFLADDEGDTGFWLDARYHAGRIQQEGGLYRADPNLQWTDTALDTDKEGAYWRGRYRTYRWMGTLGAEIYRTGIRSSESVNPRRTAIAFLHVNRRIRRWIRAGVSTKYRFQTLESENTDGDNRRLEASLYIDTDWRAGDTRLEWGFVDSDETTGDGKEYFIRVDQDMDTALFDRFNGGAEYRFGKSRDTEIGFWLSADKDLTDSLRVAGNLQRTIRKREEGEGGIYEDADARSLSASAGLHWRIQRNWRLALTYDHHRLSDALAYGDEDRRENRLTAQIRFAKTAGKSVILYGANTGNPGRGGVRGRVFIDKNQNGRQDADETGVGGVRVLIDGGYAGETDADGRFEFRPLAAGRHRVFISVEDVPLPWGLEEEVSRSFRVPVRGTGEVDFPLVNLNAL